MVTSAEPSFCRLAVSPRTKAQLSSHRDGTVRVASSKADSHSLACKVNTLLCLDQTELTLAHRYERNPPVSEGIMSSYTFPEADAQSFRPSQPYTLEGPTTATDDEDATQTDEGDRYPRQHFGADSRAEDDIRKLQTSGMMPSAFFAHGTVEKLDHSHAFSSLSASNDYDASHGKRRLAEEDYTNANHSKRSKPALDPSLSLSRSVEWSGYPSNADNQHSSSGNDTGSTFSSNTGTLPFTQSSTLQGLTVEEREIEAILKTAMANRPQPNANIRQLPNCSSRPIQYGENGHRTPQLGAPGGQEKPSEEAESRQGQFDQVAERRSGEFDGFRTQDPSGQYGIAQGSVSKAGVQLGRPESEVLPYSNEDTTAYDQLRKEASRPRYPPELNPDEWEHFQ